MKTTERPTEQEYLDATKRCAQFVVAEIMGKFDFDKAAAALAGCDWRFVDAPASPRADDLRKTAETIVKQLLEMEPGSWIGAGPIQARSRHHGDRIKERCPNVQFFVSEIRTFPDPFLAVSVPGSDTLHVIERWDEPSFRG